MTREPDRFDKQARETFGSLSRSVWNEEDLISAVAAALRATESSAMERAAQTVEATYPEESATTETGLMILTQIINAARNVRALIPSAAAPAADRCACGAEDLSGVTRMHSTDGKTHSRDSCAEGSHRIAPPAPAAEDDTPRCNTFGAMGLPSIAPAAETGTCKNFWHPGHGDEIHARRESVGDLSAPHADHVNDSGCLNWKPAAETGNGKAQGPWQIGSQQGLDKRCADALADEVAVLVQRKVIDSRSPAADALLDYRDPPRTPRSDRIAELESKAQAWADAIEYCEEGFSPEWLTDRRNRSVFAAHIYRLLIAARGAPPEREGT